MLKVLIAVDGSVHAQRAIEAVVRLQAQTKGLEALLVNVRQWPALYGDLPPLSYESIEHDQIQRQKELLETTQAAARRSGLELVATQSEAGEPASEITRVAEENAPPRRSGQDIDVDVLAPADRGVGRAAGFGVGADAAARRPFNRAGFRCARLARDRRGGQHRRDASRR